MRYWEAHITVEGDPVIIEQLVNQANWKFSKIDGDVVLGKGIKCYATRQFKENTNINAIYSLIHNTANDLKKQDITILRRKLELVVFDDRSSKMLICDDDCYICPASNASE